jgi:hypothetical protein
LKGRQIPSKYQFEHALCACKGHFEHFSSVGIDNASIFQLPSGVFATFQLVSICFVP